MQRAYIELAGERCRQSRRKEGGKGVTVSERGVKGIESVSKQLQGERELSCESEGSGLENHEGRSKAGKRSPRSFKETPTTFSVGRRLNFEQAPKELPHERRCHTGTASFNKEWGKAPGQYGDM